MSDGSRTVDDGDCVLFGNGLSDVLSDDLRGLGRVDRLGKDRPGHRARTVGDGERGRLSDRVCFVVLDDLGRSRAVCHQLSDYLSGVGDASMSGSGGIVVARVS